MSNRTDGRVDIIAHGRPYQEHCPDHTPDAGQPAAKDAREELAQKVLASWGDLSYETRSEIKRLIESEAANHECDKHKPSTEEWALALENRRMSYEYLVATINEIKASARLAQASKGWTLEQADAQASKAVALIRSLRLQLAQAREQDSDGGGAAYHQGFDDGVASCANKKLALALAQAREREGKLREALENVYTIDGIEVIEAQIIRALLAHKAPKDESAEEGKR